MEGKRDGMLAVNYSTTKNKSEDYCNRGTDKKTVHNAEYLTMIDEGIDQLSSGHGQKHELIEVDNCRQGAL